MSNHNVELLKNILSQMSRHSADSVIYPTDFEPFGLLNGETLKGLLTSVIYQCEREAREEENLKGAREQALAQMSSISGMVAALGCDYDRLQELRDEKKVCTAGWNMPGYLPDSEPESFDNWEDAADYLADEMEESAERASVDAELAQKNLDSFDGMYCDDGSTVDEAKEAVNAATRKAVNLREQAVLIRQYRLPVDYQAADGYVYWLANAEKFGLSDDDYQELTELETAAGDCENEDEARERIQEDPLDISVRSDWQNIGETLTPSEFTILLCTGGPAVRIVGELDQYNQPSRAWLEYQDWFTPWTELVDGVSHSDLLTYCQQFYFGE